MSRRLVTVSLPEHVLEKAKEICKSESRTFSGFVRICLEKQFTQSQQKQSVEPSKSD